MNNKRIELLGQKLAYCRKKAEASQQNLSILFEIERSLISEYESGAVEPSKAFLKQFSVIFDISLDDLLDDCFTMNDFEFKYPKFYFGEIIKELKYVFADEKSVDLS